MIACLTLTLDKTFMAFYARCPGRDTVPRNKRKAK